MYDGEDVKTYFAPALPCNLLEPISRCILDTFCPKIAAPLPTRTLRSYRKWLIDSFDIRCDGLLYLL